MEEINKYKRKNKIQINLRISEEASDFMKEKGISPTLIFEEKIKELMKNAS